MTAGGGRGGAMGRPPAAAGAYLLVEPSAWITWKPR